MTDAFVAKILYRKYSYAIVRLLLNTGITPNQITAVSLLLAFIGSAFFLLGEWRFLIIGAFFWVIGEIFDCVDGDLAQAKNLCSRFGAFFDSVADTIKKPLIIASLAFGYFTLNKEPIALLLAILAIANIYIIEDLRNYLNTAIGFKVHYAIKGTSFGLLDTTVAIIFFCALANQALLALTVLAFAPAVIWIRQIVNGAKTIKKAERKAGIKNVKRPASA